MPISYQRATNQIRSAALFNAAYDSIVHVQGGILSIERQSMHAIGSIYEEYYYMRLVLLMEDEE